MEPTAPIQPAKSSKFDLRMVGLSVIPHLVAILTELVLTGKVNFKSNGRDKAIIGDVLHTLVAEFDRQQGNTQL